MSSNSGKKIEIPQEPFTLEQYRQHEGEVALRMSHFFLRYLNVIYHEFDGDLAMIIVMGEVAHHNLIRFYSRAGPLPSFEEANTEKSAVYQKLELCNAFSLAAATNIPRETVRRKIDQLVKRGWLFKEPNGCVRMLHAVKKHFGPDFNLRTLKELIEVSDQLKQVLASTRVKNSPPFSRSASKQ